ncbi:MAG: hypothetical protein ABR969_03545 [Sedimentisphaerales bacterium]|jgi:hypothetical protein
MAKNGLNKKISAIFEGVPIPKNDNSQQSGGASEQPLIVDELLSSSVRPGQTIQPSPQTASLKSTAAVKNSAPIPWRKYLKQIENKLFAPKPGVDVAKQKKMAVLILALFIILIFVVTHVLKSSTPASANAQVIPAVNAQNPAVTNAGGAAGGSEGGINWQTPEKYPETLRDPMQAGVSTSGQGENVAIVVKGIVYSERPSAVIDDKIVHQGDKVSGATVVKINKNNIEFEIDGKKWTQEVRR